jgi:hypothetical protein
MPEESRFTVAFEGEPLQQGTMDVQDLAPALLGLADVIDEINTIATHGEATVTLRVRADVRRGSFHINLEIVQAAYDRFIDLFNSREVTAWAAFFSLLGLSGLGLIPLVKRSKGQKPRSVVEIEHTTRMRVVFEDKEPIEVERSVWRLFNSAKARAGLARLTRPLRRSGMTEVELAQGDTNRIAITRDEAPYFGPLSEHEGELVTESERVLRIVGMSFKEGNKWRVTEGASTFYVSLADENFADRIQRGIEKFGANDTLRVILRTRQWYEGTELKASHEIVQILQHVEGSPPQGTLDLGIDPNENEPA